MSTTDQQRVGRIVRSFQSGALCESEFVANLLDASKEIAPERLMELLPDDLAEDIVFWMSTPACSGGCDSPEFIRLSEYLRTRKE